MYIMLLAAAVTVAAQSICKQRFNARASGGAYIFSALTAFFAMLVFLTSNREWQWSGDMLLPTLGFALSYAAATVFSVLAILHGPLAKTSLLISCSLLIPSLYGIAVQRMWLKGMPLAEALSPTLLIGTLLLVMALLLVNYVKKDAAGEQKPTLRWVIFVSLAFFGNGFCSVVQAAKQDFCGNEGNGLFMIAALALSAVLMLVASFAFPAERATAHAAVKRGWWLALLCGVANGVTNLLVMALNAAAFPAAITFPVVSGGSILVVFAYSVLVKKERYTPPQYVGYALGLIAIVLLNI
jgi:drug/metabolite transporter (DMT)-like permease